MNSKTFDQNDLTDFYHGDLPCSKRLDIEDFLLESQVGLMEFFTIKREKEVPVIALPKPSDSIKHRLDLQLSTTSNTPVIQWNRRFIAAAAVLLVIAGALFMQADSLFFENSTPAPLLSVDAAGELMAETAFM